MSDLSLEDVYNLARQLDPADQQRLAQQLLRTPSPLSVESLLAILNAHAEKLRQLGVTRIGIFGSHVRDEATQSSDLDVLVQLSEHTYDAYTDVKFYLEDLFGCEVDLVLVDSIKPGIAPHILDEVRYAQNL